MHSPRRGDGGLWAMDGAAQSTLLLSVWMPVLKQLCTIKAVTVKLWGSSVGFASALSNDLFLSV